MRLVIFLSDRKLADPDLLTDNPIEFSDIVFDKVDLNQYGRDWAKMYDDDIVMVVEDEDVPDLVLAVCKHCSEKIYKDSEAVLHRWKHVQLGSYLCWSNDHTQAEPEEEDLDA